MTVFVKTEDAIYPCDGYFFIRMTNVMPNKWGVFCIAARLAAAHSHGGIPRRRGIQRPR